MEDRAELFRSTLLEFGRRAVEVGWRIAPGATLRQDRGECSALGAVYAVKMGVRPHGPKWKEPNAVAVARDIGMTLNEAFSFIFGFDGGDDPELWRERLMCPSQEFVELGLWVRLELVLEPPVAQCG